MRAALKIPTSGPPKLPDPHRWSKSFNSFIASCCVKQPEQRPTAQQLLNHTFIKNANGSNQLQYLVQLAIKHNNKQNNNNNNINNIAQQQLNNNDVLLQANQRTRPAGVNGTRRAGNNQYDDYFDDSNNNISYNSTQQAVATK